MKSKLLEEWEAKGILPTRDFEFFTHRENLVIGKLVNKEAVVEYICPYCSFYEIKNIKIEKTADGKKFKRPRFICSKCGKTIRVPDLRNV